MAVVKRKMKVCFSLTHSFSSFPSFPSLLSHGRACAAVEQPLPKLYSISSNNNNNNNNGDKLMKDYVVLRFVFCRHESMRQRERERERERKKTTTTAKTKKKKYSKNQDNLEIVVRRDTERESKNVLRIFSDKNHRNVCRVNKPNRHKSHMFLHVIRQIMNMSKQNKFDIEFLC